MRPIDMNTRRSIPRSRTRDRARLIALALVALVAAVVSACGSSTSPGSAGSSAPPIVSSPAPSQTGTACPNALVVTSADNSRTLCVANGGTVTVTAQPDQAQGWMPFDVSGTALAPAASTPAPTGTAKVLAVFSAVSPGTSTLASSHRNCPASATGMACHSILLWQVTVVVK